MFLIPLTLQNILEIRDARERVSLSQQIFFEDGQHLVDEEACEAYEAVYAADEAQSFAYKAYNAALLA